VFTDVLCQVVSQRIGISNSAPHINGKQIFRDVEELSPEPAFKISHELIWEIL
jgi:hypothetical protein